MPSPGPVPSLRSRPTTARLTLPTDYRTPDASMLPALNDPFALYRRSPRSFGKESHGGTLRLLARVRELEESNRTLRAELHRLRKSGEDQLCAKCDQPFVQSPSRPPYHEPPARHGHGRASSHRIASAPLRKPAAPTANDVEGVSQWRKASVLSRSHINEQRAIEKNEAASAEEMGMAPMGCLVFGGINIDFRAETNSPIIQGGITSCTGASFSSPGGKGANEAVALARLGVSLKL